MKRTCFILLMLLLVATFLHSSPAHPLYRGKYQGPKERASELFGRKSGSRNVVVPQHVLAVMARFSDVDFQLQPAFPDSLPHDFAYFDRYLQHLTDFYIDASHGQYLLNYTLLPTAVTLQKSMAYYGNDDLSDARMAEFTRDVILALDDSINFNDYDAVLVFHAGAGQESDILGQHTGELWSTFISRSDLQAGFDPDNDNYPGILTNDGKYIKEMVILPESEWQEGFPTDDAGYLFSLYGVMCQQFGHQLGLPTLFDNVSSNGASAGVGNFCIMGTGSWNNNGFVPALPSAWCRLYMGWDQVEVIYAPTTSIPLDYRLDRRTSGHHIYKIPISDREYFLVENVLQNPDNSSLNGSPSFTFTLLPPGEQEYYPTNPENPGADPVPFFNFMKNRYKGCEWDFMLPGYGNSSIDGSGMLIWHIDENVIEANFDPTFDNNHINADANHKGVDLEEADGLQNMDSNDLADMYRRGGPQDSYRLNNNTYFGRNYFNGHLSLPTAESYYGGIPLEIYDISAAGKQMTFSIRFGWSISAGVPNAQTVAAGAVNIDTDSQDEIILLVNTPTQGKLAVFDNETMATGFPKNLLPIKETFTYDAENKDIYIPCQSNQLVRLSKLHDGFITTALTLSGLSWASPALLQPGAETPTLWLPFNRSNNAEGILYRYKSDGTPVDSISFTKPIATNLSWFGNKLYVITGSPSAPPYELTQINTNTLSENTINLNSIPSDSLLQQLIVAGFDGDTENPELLLQSGKKLFLFSETGLLSSGFPLTVSLPTIGKVSLADVDKNGFLDIVIGGENSVAVYSHSGQLLNTPLPTIVQPDTTGYAAGAIALDMDGDQKVEYIGNMSRNRQMVWEHSGSPKTDYPKTFSNRCLDYPFLSIGNGDTLYVYSLADSGTVFRTETVASVDQTLYNSWYTEYSNYQRTGSWLTPLAGNIYQTDQLFVPNQVYMFPNPYLSYSRSNLRLQIMVSKTVNVNVKIFDIGGHCVYEQSVLCEAYQPNRDKVVIPITKLSSGIYTAVLRAQGEQKQIKFAVEK